MPEACLPNLSLVLSSWAERSALAGGGGSARGGFSRAAAALPCLVPALALVSLLCGRAPVCFERCHCAVTREQIVTLKTKQIVLGAAPEPESSWLQAGSWGHCSVRTEGQAGVSSYRAKTSPATKTRNCIQVGIFVKQTIFCFFSKRNVKEINFKGFQINHLTCSYDVSAAFCCKDQLSQKYW